ncbi:MAG: hypothetical protein COB98_07680 [Flavobacteriaceae bacterium]|nr:MAG: hypothetical protein COB98_07680 [Flavobacteriaceae bacterium]
MNDKAYFKIDTKLAKLLGETYRSTEYALKELVDNAYDADSENLEIIFPKELSPNPEIIISDNGSGMKENEVRTEYLNIANSRFVRKGKLSISKKRKIKGRKGIGKFSGLMVASIMRIETTSNGVKTSLIIDKNQLAKKGYDLEKVPLEIATEVTEENISGTKIILSGLNQNFDFPNPEKMKQLLVWDYGREIDFNITINGKEIGVLDLQGKPYSEIIEIDGKKAFLNYTITQKPIKSSGIVMKVGNKLIGKPQNYLLNDKVIPKKLQNRIYGEIICDDLEDDVTADWGTIIENSRLNKVITEKTTAILKKTVNEVFKTDMIMAWARYQRKINLELEKLPEYKRPFARKALRKTLEKFYGESESRINTVISVMVSAMEKDHYWDIISNIQKTENHDIEKFANALNDFGLLEMSIITSQTLNRLKYLDELVVLVDNPKSLEKDIHKALELNTWVLGDDYNVLISDASLESAIHKVLNKKYKGDNPKNRPDLLLGRKVSRELVLIEFKRPNFTLNRDTERQALEYRDELNTYFHNQHIEIILLGGQVKHNISSHNERDDVHFNTFLDIISIARAKLEWLIVELKKE